MIRFQIRTLVLVQVLLSMAFGLAMWGLRFRKFEEWGSVTIELPEKIEIPKNWKLREQIGSNTLDMQFELALSPTLHRFTLRTSGYETQKEAFLQQDAFEAEIIQIFESRLRTKIICKSLHILDR